MEQVYKVVCQLSCGDDNMFNSWVRQLGNLLNDMQNVEVEVVVHGLGVGFLARDSGISRRVIELHGNGVQFLVCKRALVSSGKTQKELVDGVAVVSGGLAHIVQRQAEGWSYLKVC